MVERVIALLEDLDATELDKLPPARLQRFSDVCQHWGKQAEARRHKLAAARPKAGVLRDLHEGKRGE